MNLFASLLTQPPGSKTYTSLLALPKFCSNAPTDTRKGRHVEARSAERKKKEPAAANITNWKNTGTGKTTQTHALEQGSAEHSLLYRWLCGSHPLPHICQGGREAGQLLEDQATRRGKTERGEQVVTIAGKRRNESLELWGTKVPVVERKEHKTQLKTKY